MPEPRFEPSDISPRAVALGGIAIALCVALSLLAAALLLHAAGSGDWGGGNAAPSDRPQLLDSAPAVLRERYLGEPRSHLHGYGWTDRARGRVHIPIEQAMQLLSEQPGLRKEIRP